MKYHERALARPDNRAGIKSPGEPNRTNSRHNAGARMAVMRIESWRVASVKSTKGRKRPPSTGLGVKERYASRPAVAGTADSASSGRFPSDRAKLAKRAVIVVPQTVFAQEPAPEWDVLGLGLGGRCESGQKCRSTTNMSGLKAGCVHLVRAAVSESSLTLPAGSMDAYKEPDWTNFGCVADRNDKTGSNCPQ